MGDASVKTAAMSSNTTKEFLKAGLLFLNFFIIIVIYSIVKPTRGALVVDELGAEGLPYIWMATSILIGFIVMAYGRLVDICSRQWVLNITTMAFVLTLALIRFGLAYRVPWTSAAYYIWGDVFSVVMIEQFWSFTNSLYDTDEAKRWYGFIGSGAVMGGVSGSALTMFMVKEVGTLNLIYVCAGFLGLLLIFANMAQKVGGKADLEQERSLEAAPRRPDLLAGFKLVASHSYLTLILALVLTAQVVSTVLDYKFNAIVHQIYPTLDENTAFVSQLYIWISLGALGMMLFGTRPIHRYFGVLGGLLLLPLTVIAGMLALFVFPVPSLYFFVKSADKSLNYSTFRVSKEMLYIPTSYDVKYKAKAVIDMFAYRLSKILGSALLLPFLATFGTDNVNYLVLGLGAILGTITLFIGRQYARIRHVTDWTPEFQEPSAVPA